MSTTNQLGDRIKKARICAGYSQAELAKALGCLPRTVWAWEHGSTPTPALFKELADTLDADIAWLYDGGVNERTSEGDRDRERGAAGHGAGPDLPHPND